MRVRAWPRGQRLGTMQWSLCRGLRGGETVWNQITGVLGCRVKRLVPGLGCTVWRERAAESLGIVSTRGASFLPEGGRGLDQMPSRSFFPPQCSVVAVRQIEGNQSRGPWPGFLSLINLLHCQASSLCPQIHLLRLPAGTGGPIGLVLFSRLRVRNGVFGLAKAPAWAEGS